MNKTWKPWETKEKVSLIWPSWEPSHVKESSHLISEPLSRCERWVNRHEASPRCVSTWPTLIKPRTGNPLKCIIYIIYGLLALSCLFAFKTCSPVPTWVLKRSCSLVTKAERMSIPSKANWKKQRTIQGKMNENEIQLNFQTLLNMA